MFNCGPSRGTWGKTRHLVFNSLLYVEFFRKILNVCTIFKSMFITFKIVHFKIFKNIIKIKKIKWKKNGICPILPTRWGKMRQINTHQIYIFKYIKIGTYLKEFYKKKTHKYCINILFLAWLWQYLNKHFDN